MKQIGKSNSRQSQVYVNEQYYVVAQNGIIIGSVALSFFNGEHWCFMIHLHSGMPAHGKSAHEIGSVFDLIEGDAPWIMPVAQGRSAFDDEILAAQHNAIVDDAERQLLMGCDP